MSPLQPGTVAPVIPGADRAQGPRAVMFYKVTCPTCQMAAPVAERFHQAFPERFLGVGQDPREKLDQFAQELKTSFPSVSDQPPYDVSNTYAIATVPTVVLVDDGRVLDVVESWDRDGWNRLAAKMGGLTGTDPQAVSWEGDGLPPFRPG